MTADQSRPVAPSGDVFDFTRVHLIDFFVHSLLMNFTHQLPARKALVFETDGLVCERLRRMLAEEGIASCLVDDPALFHKLRGRLRFEYCVVGVRAPHELDDFGLTPAGGPLVLLVPLEGGESSAHYRMALPEAILLDRKLRDPDALRRALQSERPAALSPLPGDPVRRTFEPFGLSERQLEVLNRALLGESSAEIARELYISELTVRNHLHAIYETVGVTGRRELLGRFVRGLVGDVPA
jgi:DNA-binding CsgD family transcriptional regulator